VLVAAISLGIVDKDRLSQRIGRNEVFSHAGKAGMVLTAGTPAAYFGQQCSFTPRFAFAVGTVPAACFVRNGDIDNRRARAADDRTSNNLPSQGISAATPSIAEVFRIEGFINTHWYRDG